jgi:endonuclease/exonuclease/phosphatase family metal-dependent hydrolase
MKKFILFIIILVLKAFLVEAQTGDTVRLCVWNLQTYSEQESEERNVSIRKILQEINPDIFVLQGIAHDSIQQLFKEVIQKYDVNAEYSRAPQERMQKSLIESHIFFKNTKVRNIQSLTVEQDSHEDGIFRFIPANTTDTFNIYVTYFRPASPLSRDDQSQFITGNMRYKYEYFYKTAVVGALYFEFPSEKGYKIITSGSLDGGIAHLADPYKNMWLPDSAAFAFLYTNSTRTNNTSGCDSTIGKGLRARHDYILNRRELLENYIPNSYTVFGNDGLDRRTSSITDPPNQKVSQEIAEALQCASSHLPVYADYVFGEATSLKETSPQTFHLSATPNPASAQSLITFTLLKESAVKLSVFDVSGQEVLKLFSGEGSFGENHFAWNTENLPQGTYFIRLEADGKSAQVQCAVVR